MKETVKLMKISCSWTNKEGRDAKHVSELKVGGRGDWWWW